MTLEKTIWDNQQQVDQLFGIDGGAAVWIRADESFPRAAARNQPSEPIGCAIQIAALYIGIENMQVRTADALGIEHALFEEMVRAAQCELRKGLGPAEESIARIT